MTNRKDHSDPLWDTRRKRLDLSLFATGAFVIVSMLHSVEMAGVVVPPAAIFAGGIIAAYFGAAEYGRVHGATTITEETIDAPPKQKTTKKTKTEKFQPEGE